MDSHRHPEADIKGVGDCHIPEPFPLWEQPEDRDRHCERDGRMRGRPAPKHTTLEQTESENLAQVHAHVVRRMGAAGNRLVPGSDNATDYLGLADRPAS